MQRAKPVGDKVIYGLESRADETAEGGFDLEEDQFSRIFCPECVAVRQDWQPKPIHVVLEDIEYPMVTCNVRGAQLATVFQTKLIDLVRPYSRHLIVGRCVVAFEGLCGYSTCYSTKPILVRGGIGEEYWTCIECGSVSRERCQSPNNILRSSLGDELVYMDADRTMYLRQALVDEIDWRQFPDAKLSKVKIVDRPLDGKRLPGDPEWGEM